MTSGASGLRDPPTDPRAAPAAETWVRDHVTNPGRCAVVYAALPVAFLIGVLRTHARRTILSRLLADLSRGIAFDDAALEEAAAAARRALRNKEPLPPLEQLTPRELEVLALAAEGRTDRQGALRDDHNRRGPRPLDLPQARPPARGHGEPPRPRGADLPQRAQTLTTRSRAAPAQPVNVCVASVLPFTSTARHVYVVPVGTVVGPA